MRPVVLVGEGRQSRPLDHDKAVLGALLAGITSGIELVVAGDDGVEHVLEWQVLEHRRSPGEPSSASLFWWRESARMNDHCHCGVLSASHGNNIGIGAIPSKHRAGANSRYDAICTAIARYRLETTDAFYSRHDRWRRQGAGIGLYARHRALERGPPVAFVNWDLVFSMIGR
jgi:hypothetical protein